MTASPSRTLQFSDTTGMLEAGYLAGKSVFSPRVTLALTEDTEAAGHAKAAKALAAYFEANERKRGGARDEAKARKVIDTLPEGVYGDWKLSWEPNEDRDALDEDAIEALYERLGLEVPRIKKPVKPSLKVTKA